MEISASTPLELPLYKEAEVHCNRANVARKAGDRNEELISSWLTIILSMAVLESYINRVAAFYSIPTEKFSGGRKSYLSIHKKWLMVSEKVSNQKIFDEKNDPIKTYFDLIKLRDSGIHDKSEFSEPVFHQKLGKVSKVRSEFCFEKAQESLGIIESVIKYWESKDGSIPQPLWRTSMTDISRATQSGKAHIIKPSEDLPTSV